MTDAIERRLTRKEASEFLRERGYSVAVPTLAKYATQGGGPVFENFGRKPLYRAADLLAWVDQRSSGPRRSTSALCAA